MDINILANSVAVYKALNGYRKDSAYNELNNWRVFLFNFDYEKYKQYFARFECNVQEPVLKVTKSDYAHAEKIVETLTSKMLFKEIAGTLSDFERAVYEILNGKEIQRKSETSMVLMMPKLYEDYIQQEQLETSTYGKDQLVFDKKIEGVVEMMHCRVNKDYGYNVYYGLLDDTYPVMFYVGHDKPWSIKLNTPTPIKARVADVRTMSGKSYTRLNYVKLLKKQLT